MDEEMQQRLTQLQARYANDLMRKAHVQGVGIGLAKVGGETTDTMALIVMVDVKLPESQLAPEDIVPRYLEGLRCDVQEVGVIQAF